MLEPYLVAVSAITLERFPMRVDWLIEHGLLEACTVAQSILEIEVGGVSIDLIPCAYNCYIRAPLPLERQYIRKMSLIDPGPFIGDAFGFEATEL